MITVKSSIVDIWGKRKNCSKAEKAIKKLVEPEVQPIPKFRIAFSIKLTKYVAEEMKKEFTFLSKLSANLLIQDLTFSEDGTVSGFCPKENIHSVIEYIETKAEFL